MSDPSDLPHMVLLRHELPDGTCHIDWLLDLDPQREGRVVCFRLETALDELEAGTRMSVMRIADHRRAYLTYEGPVADDRGYVERLATGRIQAVQNLADDWAFLISWERGSGGRHWQRLRLRKDGDGGWTVQVLDAPRAG